jgi:DNA-binding NarL/FixJ family response regulator
MARVLIVDDSAVARKNLVQILIELGHTVAGQAENGAQAFAQYVQLRPDIVTMDVSMPGMSGGDTVSKILATYPEARIIVVSALSDRQVIVDALGRGARHFLLKPIVSQKLAEVMNVVLLQEFNRDRHMQMVDKLREKYNSDTGSMDKAVEVNPPFHLEERDGVAVGSIFSHITLNSYGVLAHEINQYLALPEPKLIFHFHDTPKLPLDILLQLEKVVNVIETKRGRVKAICNDKQFFSLLSETEMGNRVPCLCAALKCFAK